MKPTNKGSLHLTPKMQRVLGRVSKGADTPEARAKAARLKDYMLYLAEDTGQTKVARLASQMADLQQVHPNTLWGLEKRNSARRGGRVTSDIRARHRDGLIQLLQKAAEAYLVRHPSHSKMVVAKWLLKNHEDVCKQANGKPYTEKYIASLIIKPDRAFVAASAIRSANESLVRE